MRSGRVLSLALPLKAGDGAGIAGRSAMQHFMARDGGDYAYLMELVSLRELAATGRSTFQLVVAPLPIVGGVGSPVNPLAVL